jgi:TonB family protein
MKRAFTSSLAVAMVLNMVTLLPVSATEYDTLMNQSYHARNAADYPRAITLQRRALALDPGNAVTKTYLCESYSDYAAKLESQKNFDNAFRQIHLALYVLPNHSASVERMRHIYKSAGLNYDDYQAHLNLAAAAFNKGDYLDAIVERRIALSMHDDEETRKALNQAIVARDKDSAYMREYDMKAVSPLGAVSLLTLADEAIDKQFLTRARTMLDSAVAMAPDDARVLQLQQKLFTAEKARALQFKQAAMQAEQQGKMHVALANWQAARSYDRNDPETESSIQRFRALGIENSRQEPAEYAKKVESTIRKKWVTSPRSMPGGKIGVLFHIAADGSVSDILVNEPSGSPELDKWTVDAIKKSAPLAVPPESVPVPVDFEIHFARNILTGPWGGFYNPPI